MKIERTFDSKLIKSILSVPEIWETISEAGDTVPDEYNVDESYYLIGVSGSGEAVGLVIVHNTSIGVPQIHVQVLPQHRKKHADEFGGKSLEWVWMNTDISKLMAFIPEIYLNVKAYSERMGFKEEGFLTRTYRNELGNWLMSINREG